MRIEPKAPFLSLDECNVGQGGVIQAMGGEDRIRYRLMEMGLLPGTRIEVMKIAPFGNPIDVKIRQHHLSLRKEEAQHILLSE